MIADNSDMVLTGSSEMPSATSLQQLTTLLRTVHERSGKPEYRLIAEKSGASLATVSDALNGKKVTRSENVEKILRAMGVRGEELGLARTLAERAAREQNLAKAGDDPAMKLVENQIKKLSKGLDKKTTDLEDLNKAIKRLEKSLDVDENELQRLELRRKEVGDELEILLGEVDSTTALALSRSTKARRLYDQVKHLQVQCERIQKEVLEKRHEIQVLRERRDAVRAERTKEHEELKQLTMVNELQIQAQQVQFRSQQNTLMAATAAVGALALATAISVSYFGWSLLANSLGIKPFVVLVLPIAGIAALVSAYRYAHRVTPSLTIILVALAGVLLGILFQRGVYTDLDSVRPVYTLMFDLNGAIAIDVMVAAAIIAILMIDHRNPGRQKIATRENRRTTTIALRCGIAAFLSQFIPLGGLETLTFFAPCFMAFAAIVIQATWEAHVKLRRVAAASAAVFAGTQIASTLLASYSPGQKPYLAGYIAESLVVAIGAVILLFTDR